MALEEIKEKFAGKWKQDRKENFEEFLKVMKINYVMRKMMNNVNPEEEISVEDDHIVVRFKAGPMTKESKFKLNEEFEEERMGIMMKIIGRYEDGKIKMECSPTDKEMKVQHATRERVGEEVLLTVVVGDGDVTCKRYFKRVPT
ncbi:hypothetical protein LOTGIDRAFT_157889 [Lottia gigantea]|uniref:Uncharacterized protein n=1 Tax=Lottia gigantea TaxID=225164 RepID=V4ATI6_LOTGI|nr:hypothetical protein LOTGIDRAFT_157889 [Lottia gigantea]ESP00608.1 hypothetical protein LOTGIDRAFT_157889 [Lottia gigantea]